MLLNQLEANWRNYSPGGMRRRITHIPFNGEINTNLRAMGTKRIPVVSSRLNKNMKGLRTFNYMNQGISIDYNRSVPMQPPSPYTNLPLSESDQEYSPGQVIEEPYVPPSRRGQVQRRPLRNLNQGIRSTIDTAKEVRGWKRELDPTRSILRQQRVDLNKIALNRDRESF